MTFPLARSIDVLSRTPRVLRAALGGLDESLTHANYGPNTFSPLEVLGHLIEGERTDWMPRARIILEHGDAVPFEPFDPRATYDPAGGASTSTMLDEFESLRTRNLDELRALDLDESDLARRGRHPALGPVTLGELLATWAAHDLHHIAQVAKAMAYQHRDFVGPWRAYLGIIRQAEQASSA